MQFSEFLKNSSLEARGTKTRRSTDSSSHLFFQFKISILGSKYGIWWHSEKCVPGDPRHVRVVDKPTILSKIFLDAKTSLLGRKYAICWVSEKSTSGGLGHPTAADRSPVISANSKMLSQREPLLRPIIMATWSDFPRILSDLISMRFGQTDVFQI